MGVLHSQCKCKHVVDITEVVYCIDTRMAAKIAEKQKQHDQLRRLLLEACGRTLGCIFPLDTLD